LRLRERSSIGVAIRRAPGSYAGLSQKLQLKTVAVEGPLLADCVAKVVLH
jgi:hypothetical protein